VHPQTFTLRNIADRVEAVGDLWADMRKHKYSLRRPKGKIREAESR
jgi:hypothetical protein